MIYITLSCLLVWLILSLVVFWACCAISSMSGEREAQ